MRRKKRNENQLEEGVMTRSQSRELAFVIIFQKSFHDEPVEEIIRCSAVGLEQEISPFARALAEGAEAHLEEIDERLSACSQNWKLSRISRVSLAALRIAAYEMLFVEEIPVSVSINEAIELTKKYASAEDGAYVNGVLGALARQSGLPAPAAEETAKTQDASRGAGEEPEKAETPAACAVTSPVGEEETAQ
ncbi:MAG: transcription antitermination factor NusB [Provencibacterium sp.]|nr:transcription antitermination factor NusB [Provencibacterium sp.]